jgi:hypothetical protein
MFFYPLEFFYKGFLCQHQREVERCTGQIFFLLLISGVAVLPILRIRLGGTQRKLAPLSYLLSKLLDKIVCRQLVAHLEDNELIYAHQYGFQHGKPTEHNLIQLTNFLHSALN